MPDAPAAASTRVQQSEVVVDFDLVDFDLVDFFLFVAPSRRQQGRRPLLVEEGRGVDPAAPGPAPHGPPAVAGVAGGASRGSDGDGSAVVRLEQRFESFSAAATVVFFDLLRLQREEERRAFFTPAALR